MPEPKGQLINVVEVEEDKYRSEYEYSQGGSKEICDESYDTPY